MGCFSCDDFRVEFRGEFCVVFRGVLVVFCQERLARSVMNVGQARHDGPHVSGNAKASLFYFVFCLQFDRASISCGFVAYLCRVRRLSRVLPFCWLYPSCTVLALDGSYMFLTTSDAHECF